MFEKRTDPHAPQTFSPNGSLPRKEQFFTTFLKSDFAFPLEMTNSKMCQSFCPPKICFIIAAGTSLSSSVSFGNRRARSGRAGGVTCRCRRARRGRCRRPNPAAGTPGRGSRSDARAVPGHGPGRRTASGFFWLSRRESKSKVFKEASRGRQKRKALVLSAEILTTPAREDIRPLACLVLPEAVTPGSPNDHSSQPWPRSHYFWN